jgi:4-hydroxy-tetrahydrodipicolinate synthase
MYKAYICAAIGTPLTDDELLHGEGLRRHLDDQYRAGIDGVLVGGTMGAMQLLTGAAYTQLIKQSVAEWSGRGELLIGVGDLSYGRTRERLQYVNEYKVDGAVVLTPMLLNYTQAELLQYYRSLADESRAPLYLYDLPQRTGNALELETVVQLAKHPNIAGIKCSGDAISMRRLCDAVHGKNFRVIVAQAILIDILLRSGFHDHVDGIYCIVPKLTTSIRDAAMDEDWELAATRSQLLTSFLMTVVRYGVMPAMTALLNARNIPGCFAPKPHIPLNPADCERLLAEPDVVRAFAADSLQSRPVPVQSAIL